MKKLILIAAFIPSIAFARGDATGSYKVDLGRGITIIQCGHVDDIKSVCEVQKECCVFIDQGLENRMCEIYVSKDYYLPVCVKVD